LKIDLLIGIMTSCCNFTRFKYKFMNDNIIVYFASVDYNVKDGCCNCCIIKAIFFEAYYDLLISM
jgi:hypothetical protein